MGEDVGDDPVLPRVAVEARGPPLLPGAGEVGEQLGVVDASNRLVVVGLGLDDAARPSASSAARIRSARSGSSVPGVRTPTQISPPGSCRRWRSLQTTGIARLTARRA